MSEKKQCPVWGGRTADDVCEEGDCAWYIDTPEQKGCAVRLLAESVLRDERIRYSSCQRNCGNSPDKCVGCFNHDGWVPMKGNEPVKRCLP